HRLVDARRSKSRCRGPGLPDCRKRRQTRSDKPTIKVTMMKLLFLSILILLPVAARALQPSPIERADSLFTARDNGDSLKQATLLMEQLTARERSTYEAWWRLARLRYYL